MIKRPFRGLTTLGFLLSLVNAAAISASWQPVEARHASQNASQNGNERPVVSASNDGAPVDVDRIIRAFPAKDTEFRRALAEYAFERDATVQTVGTGGQLTGEYHRKSQFVFDDHAERFEK